MFLFTRNDKVGELVALDLQSDGIAAARIVRPEYGKPQLVACEYQPLADGASAAVVLRDLRSRLRLNHTRCATILPSDHYHLLLTEAPQVPENELRAALRWQIKDLIEFNVEQASLDVIDLPLPKRGDAGKPVYVVAADSKAVDQHVAPLHAAQINLQIVDIHEMAQRNIAAALSEDQTGLALVSLTETWGIISLTRAGTLFLTRRIGFGWNHIADRGESAFEQVQLELQRSIDYFESYLRQPPVQHVILAPAPDRQQQLESHLQANIALPVQTVDLETIVDCICTPPDDWQTRHFFACGAALRQEVRTK